MKNEKFASADMTAGQLNAIVKKLGNYEGAMSFLRGEITVSKPDRLWQEGDGVIYFSLPSDGTTGPEWITRLESKGKKVSDLTKKILCSSDFKPTKDMIYEVGALKGFLFEDKNRITKNIRTDAENRSWDKPNFEVACLIRETFSNEEIKEMGLNWIITMHEPFKDSVDDLHLLGTYTFGGDDWLLDYWDNPGLKWNRRDGFAFVVSKVSTQVSES